jgi:hypothetical protein
MVTTQPAQVHIATIFRNEFDINASGAMAAHYLLSRFAIFTEKSVMVNFSDVPCVHADRITYYLTNVNSELLAIDKSVFIGFLQCNRSFVNNRAGHIATRCLRIVICLQQFGYLLCQRFKLANLASRAAVGGYVMLGAVHLTTFLIGPAQSEMSGS